MHAEQQKNSTCTRNSQKQRKKRKQYIEHIASSCMQAQAYDAARAEYVRTASYLLELTTHKQSNKNLILSHPIKYHSNKYQIPFHEVPNPTRRSI